MISVEFFDPSTHFETIGSWWTAQGWPVIPLSHLPRTGIVVLVDGKPAAAAWIYKTDSAICWLEWVVADPQVRGELRSSVLSVLISTGKIVAKSLGFDEAFMTIKHDSLGKRIQAHGFVARDEGATNFTCNLSRR